MYSCVLYEILFSCGQGCPGNLLAFVRGDYPVCILWSFRGLAFNFLLTLFFFFFFLFFFNCWNLNLFFRD